MFPFAFPSHPSTPLHLPATKNSSSSNDAGENSAIPQEAAQGDTPTTTAVAGASFCCDPDPDESRYYTAEDTRRRSFTQATSRGHASHGLEGEAHDRETRAAPRPARMETIDVGRGGTGASGVLSSVEVVARPSTAPMHSDGKVIMRPVGRVRAGAGGAGSGAGAGAGEGGGQDPPSVVFEPGFSRLRTQRVILDRRAEQPPPVFCCL